MSEQSESIKAVLAIGKSIESHPEYAEKLKKIIAKSDNGEVVEFDSDYESYLFMVYIEYLEMTQKSHS